MFLIACAVAGAQEYSRVTVVLDDNASAMEKRYAGIFARRVNKFSKATVTVGQPAKKPGEIVVHLGVIENRSDIAAAMHKARIGVPTDRDPGPEGFAIYRKGGEIFAGAVDTRGVLYAVGALIRQITFHEQSVTFPEEIALWSAPAFEVRGIMVSQGHTITELTHSRKWTQADWEEAVLDYVLAGANAISMGYSIREGEPQYDFVRSLGIKTLVSWYPNMGNSNPEWEAVEAIGRPGYYCISIPAARAQIVERFEAQFRDMPHMDYVRFYSGDGGGCECDDCDPFGAKYIALCHELAAIVGKYHPDAEVFATNQKLDNAGDLAIFDYLRKHPDWLRGFGFGPGSNAMGWMPGRRQDHRMDLFRYPAFGSMDRYLREIIHELPPTVDLVFYTDITHWVYSQYGLMDHEIIADRNHDVPPRNDRALYTMRPDPNLVQVYNRRTFHARPRAYYNAFQQTQRYGIGDAIYSEGHHDHFNQWMWMRLLWNPNVSVESLIAEYALESFGPDAAPLMERAIMQMETNLSAPILRNGGIDAQLLLLREARPLIPANRMEKDYLWRQYMQKALVDKYIQLRVARQTDLYAGVVKAIEAEIDTNAAALAERCNAMLAEAPESEEMLAIKVDADALGKESDAIYGVRNEGLFNLDQDFVGLGWVRQQVARALTESGETQRETLRQIARYEDPGEGGFYDDAGDPARSPRLVQGWPYGESGFAGANRPSQRTAAFTTDEEQGVTFEYHDLDPGATYRVRVTLVRPRFLPRFAKFQHQKTQSIYADDALLVQDVELPEFESKFFEYDVPQEATKDGHLLLRFMKSAGVGEGPRPDVTVWRNTGGWGTLVSEVWLMKQ